MKNILACLVLIATMAHAQDKVNDVPAYGVYTSASDFDAHHLTDGFNTIDNKHKLRDEVTHYVYVVNDGSSHKYPYDSIWGFRRKGEDWRIFDNRIYKVVYTGKAYVYIRPTKTDFSVPGLTRFETTYFSATPTSPIYQLTKQNLITAYADKPAFVGKVSALPPSALATKKDKVTGLYQFITWL
jgi:hypothetical protein